MVLYCSEKSKSIEDEMRKSKMGQIRIDQDKTKEKEKEKEKPIEKQPEPPKKKNQCLKKVYNKLVFVFEIQF